VSENETAGEVLWGSNNIFSVWLPVEQRIVECRFKGKKLQGTIDEYNALVPGDAVIIEVHGSGGMISRRSERRNVISRWNKKENCPQAFAANVDVVCVVCSPNFPPFRPRFLDRCIAAADSAEVPISIILNKVDQGLAPEVEDRLAGYQEMGYEVLALSASTGEGLPDLLELLQDKRSLFMGQSGVGKSSLLKALHADAVVKIGEISEKFNRGRHTTVLARLYPVPGLGEIIDSPGVREFEPATIDPQALSHLFRDIAPLIPECGRYNCSHTNELDCAVRSAALSGVLDADRYESYLRLYEALCQQGRKY
jgi:ribosome biogenesis GTPase